MVCGYSHIAAFGCLFLFFFDDLELLLVPHPSKGLSEISILRSVWKSNSGSSIAASGEAGLKASVMLST